MPARTPMRLLARAAVPALAATLVTAVPATAAPALPTGLAARTPTNAAPSLSWSPVAGATIYRVYRGGILIAKPNKAAYVDTGVTASGTYSYTVAAVNGTGASAQTKPVAVAYDVTVPAAPADVRPVAAATAGVPQLAWSPASDAGGSGLSGYEVRRDGAVVWSGPATTFADTAAGEGVQTYSVRARDAAGNLSAATAVTVLVDRTAPSAPQGVSAPLLTAGAPALLWTAAADPAPGAGVYGYRVFRGDTQVAMTTSTGYIDPDAPEGESRYTVVAVDVLGNASAPSTAVTVVVDRTPPAAPAMADVPAATAGPVDLRWSGPGAAFRVLRDGEVVAETGETRFTDPRPADGRHTYAVVALDAAGNASAASAPVSVEVDTAAPDAVTPAVAPVVGGAPALEWAPAADGGSGVAVYRVLRDGEPVAETADLRFVDADAPEGRHGYAVVAVDRAGNRAAGGEATTLVDRTAPAAPAAPEGPRHTAAAPALWWDAATDAGAGIAAYEILRDGEVLARPADAAYTDAAAGEGDHRYQVVALDAAGNRSQPGPALAVTVDRTAPTTPVLHAAGAITAGPVELAWDGVADGGSGVAAYRVVRDDETVATTDATAFVDRAADGVHRYALVAVDRAGNVSEASAAVAVTVDTAAPAAVAVAVAPLSPAAPELTWPAADDAGTGVAAYQVLRDGEPVARTAATTWADADAGDGRHAYAVVAVDAAGNASAGPEARTLVDRAAPETPAGPSGDPYTAAAPALRWEPAGDGEGSGVVAYRVERDGALAGTTTEPRFVDDAAGEGTHRYAVVAVDAAGHASPAGPAATVVVDATAPAAPTVRADADVTAGPVALAWLPVADGGSGVDRYRVLRDGDPVAVVTEGRYAGTAPEGTHRFRVEAVDRAGNTSAPSDAVAVTVDTTAPAAPGRPRTTSAAYEAPALEWDAAAGDAVRYEVRRDGRLVATVERPAYVDADAPAGAVSAYTVTAVDRAGNTGPASGETAVRRAERLWSGVSTRLSGDSSLGQRSDLKLISIMLHWKNVEPSRGVYKWGNLEASLRDARARGYRVIVRVMAGAYAPAWLETDATDPVTTLDLLATDGAVRPITVPLPWDPDLLDHYRRLMVALDGVLARPNGYGGTLADSVLFVPVSMSTELGSEMSLGYGAGTYTGAYRGVVGTYDAAATNRAEWFANAPRGTTTAERQQANRDALAEAWRQAVDTQVAVLRTPSGVAFGGLFMDNYVAARRLAESIATAYPTRVYAMTTNLQPKVRADGTFGPWSEWNPAAAETIATFRSAAARACGWDCATIGFQSTGPNIIKDEAMMRAAVEDGLASWDMRFFETAPDMLSDYAGTLLGTDGVQARMARRYGA